MEQNKKKDRRAWPTGVLTEDAIKKNVKRGNLPRAILYSVAAVVLGVAAWPSLMAVSDMDLKVAALLAGIGFLLVLAFREWMGVLSDVDYRMETDRVAEKQMQTTYEDKDAERLDLPTKTPVLILEKHGIYRIQPEHIHSQYTVRELYRDIEAGEEVYVIYSRQGKRLLRIFRKKYWTLPENK